MKFSDRQFDGIENGSKETTKIIIEVSDSATALSLENSIREHLDRNVDEKETAKIVNMFLTGWIS